MSISVMVVYATTAQASALAPLMAALSAHPGSRTTTVVTGEHRYPGCRARADREALRAAGRAGLDSLERPEALRADHDLGLTAGEHDRNTLTAEVFTRFGHLLTSQHPDAVLVGGTTTSICAVALTAFNHGIPVLLLEVEPSGEQSCSLYPREAERGLLERVSTVHLVTSAKTRLRLVRQGVPEERIVSAGAPAPSPAPSPAHCPAA